MKKVFDSFTTVAVFIALSALAGCQMRPSALDEEAVHAKVDSAMKDLEAANETANAEDWEAFKAQSEENIRMNELSIADLKDRMTMSQRKEDALYLDKINKHEKQNEALKTRIKTYDVSGYRKENQEAFKREFNHDVKELGQAIKDLAVNNEK
jgi:hypothetical protein